LNLPTRIVLVAGVLAGSVSLAAAAAPASGTIGRKGSVLKVVDAFAYESTSFIGKDPSIRVRLSAKPLDHAALSASLDFERELNSQQQGVESVELEFSPAGAWSGGGSFMLGPATCGWCQDGGQADKAVTKVQGGVLTGTLKTKASDVKDGTGVDADLVLNVPIARHEGVTALPASGGDPGKAYLSCLGAMKATDEAAIVTSCFGSDHAFVKDANLDYFEGAAFAAHAGQSFQGLMLEDVTVSGGRVKGDDAEILVKGKIVSRYGQDEPETVERYKGRVFLRRGATGWRISGQELESDNN
jgi:hypothetical protein